MSSSKRIGYWVSEKKAQKINWQEFKNICKSNGFELVKLDLSKDLDSQGPFKVILHKLTDIILSAQEGDEKNLKIVRNIEHYLLLNPSVVVIDPIPKVRLLLDRYVSYKLISSAILHEDTFLTPTFCELNSNDPKVLSDELRQAGVTYPFLCKPKNGHGSKAHEMSIIFNEHSLLDCKPPCVAQSFINHNAILYKIFLVNNKYKVVERPSIKNFYSTDIETIHFMSSEVSKAGAHSELSVLDQDDQTIVKRNPDVSIIKKIANSIKDVFQMDLLGIDFVIDNSTGRYAVIDVNVFPGYDEFPNFLECLFEHIKSKIGDVFTEKRINCDNLKTNNISKRLKTV